MMLSYDTARKTAKSLDRAFKEVSLFLAIDILSLTKFCICEAWLQIQEEHFPSYTS